jgi:hypothetical protein
LFAGIYRSSITYTWQNWMVRVNCPVHLPSPNPGNHHWCDHGSGNPGTALAAIRGRQVGRKRATECLGKFADSFSLAAQVPKLKPKTHLMPRIVINLFLPFHNFEAKIYR